MLSLSQDPRALYQSIIEDSCSIGWMANDIVGPSCDELVVLKEGDMECEMPPHLAIAPIPDRGTQYYQDRREGGSQSEFDTVCMFTIWQQGNHNSFRPGASGLHCSRHNNTQFNDCICPISGLIGG